MLSFVLVCDYEIIVTDLIGNSAFKVYDFVSANFNENLIVRHCCRENSVLLMVLIYDID